MSTSMAPTSRMEDKYTKSSPASVISLLFSSQQQWEVQQGWGGGCEREGEAVDVVHCGGSEEINENDDHAATQTTQPAQITQPTQTVTQLAQNCAQATQKDTQKRAHFTQPHAVNTRTSHVSRVATPQLCVGVVVVELCLQLWWWKVVCNLHTRIQCIMSVTNVWYRVLVFCYEW